MQSQSVSDLLLSISADDGRHIELDARCIRDPALLLRALERLLRPEDSER